MVLLVCLAWDVYQRALRLYRHFGHRGHVQLRIKVRKRMAIGVDDEVVLDRRHVCDKVVGGDDGLLQVEAVVAQLADVSWQGRPEVR